jgi:hypothetical protein
MKITHIIREIKIYNYINALNVQESKSVFIILIFIILKESIFIKYIYK